MYKWHRRLLGLGGMIGAMVQVDIQDEPEVVVVVMKATVAGDTDPISSREKEVYVVVIG